MDNVAQKLGWCACLFGRQFHGKVYRRQPKVVWLLFSLPASWGECWLLLSAVRFWGMILTAFVVAPNAVIVGFFQETAASYSASVVPERDRKE